MKVELKDLREQPIDVKVDCSPESLELSDADYRFEEPVRGKLTFTLIGDRVVANGSVSTSALSQCVRCLSEVRLPIKASVDALYENDPELQKPEMKAFGSDEQIVTWFDGESIRPEPEIRESLMLELPTLPLCSEGCKGLCPTCGANLNEGNCTCGERAEDTSSWKSAIKQIKLE